MKIPAILLFLLLWSNASCNLAERDSADESGHQAIFTRQNDIERSDGSETSPDGRHRKALPMDGMSDDCYDDANRSNVDRELAIVDTVEHGSGRNQKEGRPRLLRQKATGLIDDGARRTKKKDSITAAVPSVIASDEELALDVLDAIGKVVMRHMLKKYMSSISLESLTHVPNDKRHDMVKNGIDRVGKVTPPLNNVPLISGEKDVEDDDDYDVTKTGPRSLKSAVAEIGKFETPPATGERKEDATQGGTTSELVKPLSSVAAANCADESKKGSSSRTESIVERFSTEGAYGESAIEHDQNAPAPKRGSRQKRSLHFGQTYGERGTDPRLLHWSGLKTEFTTGRHGVTGTTHDNPVAVNEPTDWRRFSLDDLLNGGKTQEQKRESNAFQIYNWGKDNSEKDTGLQSWSNNLYTTRKYSFDRSGLNDFDTRFALDNDYKPNRFRTYSWDIGKQGVGNAEKQNKGWNFGVSHGENEANRFASGGKWNTRRLYQPQTGSSDEQQSDIGTRKNKLSNQRSLYQFSIGSGTQEGKDKKKEGMANIKRFQSTTVPNKYRVASLPTVETMTSGILQGKNQRKKGTVNANSFQSTARRNKVQIAPLPTIATMTSGILNKQKQNNGKTVNTNRFQSTTKGQIGAFQMNNQKSERTANKNRFELTKARNKYQITQLPTIETYTSERPQMKNQKYAGSASTLRFQSTAPTNNYRVHQLPTISSTAENSRNTHKRIQYSHLGGSYDLGFAGADISATPKITNREQFARKRYSFLKTKDSSDSTKNSYNVLNFERKQGIATTAATKIDTEANGKKGKRSGEKSAKSTGVVHGNSYGVFLKKGTGGIGTGRLYRYNQAGNSRGSAVEKVERSGLTGKGLETWNAQSSGAQSDATTHNDISGRRVHFDRGRSTFSNAVRKQGSGAREHGNPIASQAAKVIRYDRAGNDASTNVRVSKFGVQMTRSKTGEFSNRWQRPSTKKTTTTKAPAKQEKNKAQRKYVYSTKKSKPAKSVEEKTSSESSEFQFIPLVLTPMGTATRRWSRGRSTIKNQRIYYNPEEVFNMHERTETAKKTDSESDVTNRSKSKTKSTTSGSSSNAYVQWRNGNNKVKNVRTANKNPSRKSDSSTGGASVETYNRFPLILTAVPTSKSYVPIRGVKNKRISTNSAEGMQSDFDNRFSGGNAVEEEEEEAEEGEVEGEIRRAPTKGNYGPSEATSEVINYGKDGRDSSPKQSGKFGVASAASGAGSYGQSHVESAELSKSRAAATDKGSGIEDSAGAASEKGSVRKDGNVGERKDDSVSNRVGSAYKGIRNGELSEERQFGQISRPSAAAEVPPADIESSSGSSEGFAESAAYNGNAAKGSSVDARWTELRSTSSAASEAGDETVERETSGDKLAGLSGRTDSVSAGGMGRVGRIEDASAGSMARDGKDEEWRGAKRIFAYRKYTTEGQEGVGNRRLANRQLADKYSGAGANLHAGGVRGTARNSETSAGGAENVVYERGSAVGGIGGLGRKSTTLANARGESSVNGKRGQSEFHAGASADVSTNSIMMMQKNSGKSASLKASAKVSGETMSVENGMEHSSNENSASTEAHSKLGSHKTKADWEADKSAGEDLSGDESRTHGMKEYGSDEKQRSSGINIAGGGTSADASEKFREENSEWLVGKSRNGWHRRGALGAHDKGAARAAESALSDKSPAESSAYGKLASNEIRRKSAKEISRVSSKSGSSAESGRYTAKLSDASLKDSTKVTNGIRWANGNAAKEAESMSAANSQGVNSVEDENQLDHGSSEGTSSISDQVLGVRQKNMAKKGSGIVGDNVNNVRAVELDLVGSSSKSTHPSGQGSNEKASLISGKTYGVKKNSMSDNVSGVSAESMNNAGAEVSDLNGASSGSLTNSWLHGKNSKLGLTSNKWSSKSSHPSGHGTNEKSSLISGQAYGVKEKSMSDNDSGASADSVNNAGAEESELNGASSGSLTNSWLHGKNSKLGLSSNKWSSKSSHDPGHGSNEKASLISGQAYGVKENSMSDNDSGASADSVNNAGAKESELSGASSGSLTNSWLHGKNSKLGLTSNKWSLKSSHPSGHGTNEKASLISGKTYGVKKNSMSDNVSGVSAESMNNAGAEESELNGASSGSLTNSWLHGKNSKLGLSSNKWSSKSSHDPGHGSNEKASLISGQAYGVKENSMSDNDSGASADSVNNAGAKESELSGASSGSLTNSWLHGKNSKHGLTSNKWSLKSSHPSGHGTNEKSSLMSGQAYGVKEKSMPDNDSGALADSVNNAGAEESEINGASSGSLMNSWLHGKNYKLGLTSNKWSSKSSHPSGHGTNEKSSLISGQAYGVKEKSMSDNDSGASADSVNNAGAEESELNGAPSGSLRNSWLHGKNSKLGLSSNKWSSKSSHDPGHGSNEKASLISGQAYGVKEKSMSDNDSGASADSVNNAGAEESELNGAPSGSLRNSWLHGKNSKLGLSSNKWSSKSSHDPGHGSNEKASLISGQAYGVKEKSMSDNDSGASDDSVTNAGAEESELNGAPSGSVTNSWLHGKNAKLGLSSNKWSSKSTYPSGHGSKGSLISGQAYGVKENSMSDNDSGASADSVNNAGAEESELNGASSGSLTNSWLHGKNSKLGLLSNKWSSKSTHPSGHGSNEKASLISGQAYGVKKNSMSDNVSGASADSVNNAGAEESELNGASSGSLTNDWSQDENSEHGLTSVNWPPKPFYNSAKASSEASSTSIQEPGLKENTVSNIGDVNTGSVNTVDAHEFDYIRASSGSLTKSWFQHEKSKHRLLSSNLPPNLFNEADHGADKASLTSIDFGTNEKNDNVNSARSEESNLPIASSGLFANDWSQDKNSKHALTSSTWSPKSSGDFGSVHVSADVKSGSVNIKGLDAVKGSNSLDKTSSDLFTNTWEYGKSQGNGLRTKQLSPASLRTFGATKSNVGAESKSNIQRLNLAHGEELETSSDSSAFANAWAQSDVDEYGTPANKLSSSFTFDSSETDALGESGTTDKNSIIDLLKSPSQSSILASLQDKMQSDRSNRVLLAPSSANVGTAASERSKSDKLSKSNRLSIKGSNNGWFSDQSVALSKSSTETLSDTDSEEPLTKDSNTQDIRNGQSKLTGKKLSSESSEHPENYLSHENDRTSAKRSNWQFTKKSLTSSNAKADVETFSTGSPKSEIEIIAPTKGSSKSGASHESLVSVKGTNEIHDTNIPAKQPSASSSSNADSGTYANGELSGDRYKWKSGASKIPPLTAASQDSAVAAETSTWAGSQAKTSAHGQLIGNNFSLEKSGINNGHPPSKFVKHAASKYGGNSNSAADKNGDELAESSSGSAIESIISSDGGWGLSADKLSGRSFAELPEAPTSSVASAGTQGKAANDAYSMAATESEPSSELAGRAGTYGTDKQAPALKSSSSAFASSSGSRTNWATLTDRELSDDLAAASVASGEGLAGWSSDGLANGEAPQAKQSALSGKSHAEGSSERVDKLGEFNSKKLTDEFTAVSSGSSSSGSTEKLGTGGERWTATLAAQKVTGEDRGWAPVSGEAESTSLVSSDEHGKEHELEGKDLSGGYGEKLFRDPYMAAGNFGDKSGMARYLDVSEKGTGKWKLMRPSNLGLDDSESDESKIRRAPGKYTESDFVWPNGKDDAKNARGFKYGSANEGKSFLFMKGSSGAISRAKANEKGEPIKLGHATADPSSSSELFKSLGRMKWMNRDTELVPPNGLSADEYKIWMKTNSKSEATAQARNVNTIENRKQVHAKNTRNEANANAKSLAVQQLKLIRIQNVLPQTSEFQGKNKAETEIGASSSSSTESSRRAWGRGEIKGDIQENVSLNESRAKAAAYGSVGNDKLSGKKFAGKLIDASSEVAAGAGSQRHEFDGKDAGSVVSDTKRTIGIAGTKSMSSAWVDSSGEESADKESGENKWAQSLSHSKVIEDPRGKSASRAVSGKLISASDSAVAALRKKWSPAESDTISSEIRGLAKMRNKLPAGEEDLSSLSIVKNEGADAELINGKWSAASGGVLAKSRVDAVGAGKSSISSEAGESSESDSAALLRSMGGDKLREWEEIDELADATAASTASGKANSKIASGHVGQPGSGSSRLTSNSKSGALSGAEVYAATSAVNAKRDSSARTSEYSSSESKASEALDMLTSSGESSEDIDESSAKSWASLAGPKSSSNSQAHKNAESGKKGAVSSSEDQSAELLHPPTAEHGKSQKLTLKNANDYVKSNEASHDGLTLQNERSGTGSRTKSSDTSASAENYGVSDVGGKLAGKWTVGSASFGKSAARDDSSLGRKSSSLASQDPFNMQAGSESADFLERDALSSDGAINGKWRFWDMTDASAKSAATRGQELSAGSRLSIGNASGGSASASRAASAGEMESGEEMSRRNSDDAGNGLKMKGMNSEGKNKNGGEWGGWAKWVEANEWKENREGWMERLRKNLVDFSGEEGTAGNEKSDEQTNEGLMFISYDSLGQAAAQGKNVNRVQRVQESGGDGDASLVDFAEWTNGDFDRQKVRKEEISGLLSDESNDGSESKEKSPHAAVIVPFTSAEWWSKKGGNQKNAGQDGKPSLFKFLGREEKNWPESKDESQGNDKFMTAEEAAGSTDTEADLKNLQKGKRIELIPVTSTDSDHHFEWESDVTDSSKPESKDEEPNKKKKCIQLFTVPSENSSDPKEHENQFVKGVSYEFEPDSSSSVENNDNDSEISDQIQKKQNPKKPYKICLDLDSADATNDNDMDKPRTEIYVVRWTSQGPVKVAKIEDKVKPAVIYKLLSRHIYEKIRNLLAH